MLQIVTNFAMAFNTFLPLFLTILNSFSYLKLFDFSIQIRYAF